MKRFAVLIALGCLAGCSSASITPLDQPNTFRLEVGGSLANKPSMDSHLGYMAEYKCPQGWDTTKQYMKKGPDYPMWVWEIACLKDDAPQTAMTASPERAVPTVATPQPASVSPQASRPYTGAYDLRGFKLGMTLAEFRAMPHPDAAKLQAPHVLCTGDPGVDKPFGGWELNVYGLEAKVGIIRCNHFSRDPTASTAKTKEVNLNVAGVGVYQTFEFAADPKDGMSRLFRITVRSNMMNWDQFFGAYSEKFGKPTDVTTDKVQNGLGASFDKVTATWANTESSITLEQRAGKVQLMGITYRLNDIAANVARQIEAIEGKPSSKL